MKSFSIEVRVEVREDLSPHMFESRVRSALKEEFEQINIITTTVRESMNDTFDPIVDTLTDAILYHDRKKDGESEILTEEEKEERQQYLNDNALPTVYKEQEVEVYEAEIYTEETTIDKPKYPKAFVVVNPFTFQDIQLGLVSVSKGEIFQQIVDEPWNYTNMFLIIAIDHILGNSNFEPM